MRNWLPFANALGEFFFEFVLEIYASYHARQEIMGLRSPAEKYPKLFSVLVRGVEVDITPASINFLFWTESITEVSEKVASKVNHLQMDFQHYCSGSAILGD